MSSTVMAIDATDHTASEIAQMAKDLSMSFRDPEALMRRLSERIASRFPERVASAYWVTASGVKDKGITVDVYRLPLNLRIQTLFGVRTGGVGMRTPAFDVGVARLAIGAAVVAPYVDLKSWEPAAYLRVSF